MLFRLSSYFDSLDLGAISISRLFDYIMPITSSLTVAIIIPHYRVADMLAGMFYIIMAGTLGYIGKKIGEVIILNVDKLYKLYVKKTNHKARSRKP